MKNVILIAAPAAGKGTEAAKLKKQYNMLINQLVCLENKIIFHLN